MLIFALAFFVSVNCMPITENEIKTATEHLQKYGHMVEDPAGNNTLSESLMKYQMFMGLNVTGKLDKSMMDFMKRPRCGMSDFSGKVEFSWLPDEEVVYTITEYPISRPKVHYDREIREAFGKWSRHINVRFVQGRRPTVWLGFKLKNHGDEAFDGPGVVVAHALANERIHFDSDEDWSEDASGINVQQTAVHEIGHLLGLPHSNNTDSVMFPVILPFRDDFHLHPEDIESIQRHLNITHLRLRSEVSSAINPKDFDTIFRMNDGRIFTLHDRAYIEYDSGFVEVRRGLVEERWRFLPERVNAALHNPRNGLMYFFKGMDYWKYNGTEVDPKSSVKIFNGFPGITNTTAVTLWRKKIYFFYYNVFMEHNAKVGVVEEIPISSRFPGVPNSARGVISMDDNTIYFFRRDSYYIYNAITNSTQSRKLCSLFKCL